MTIKLHSELLQREISEIGTPHSLLSIFQILEGYQIAVHGAASVSEVLGITGDYVSGLDIFKTFGIYVGSLVDGVPECIVCEPADTRPALDHFLREQTSVERFRKTLAQSRFVSFPLDASTLGRFAVFVRLGDSRETRGILVGILPEEIDEMAQAKISLVTLFLTEAGNLIENFRLRAALNKEKDLLSARVEERTAELTDAKRASEAASRAKSEFLAVMSHELRTPLNGVLGFSNLLTETGLSDIQLEYLEKVRSCAENLRGLIDDILDFSKIESGRLPIEADSIFLRDLVESVLQIHAWEAAVNHNELVYRLDPAIPPWIVGDPSRLQQILSNLLGNAIKFTRNGVVRVEVSRVGGDHAGDEAFDLRFEVIDDGIGFDPSRKEAIFGAFTQGDSSDSRRFGGMGLGLAIVQRLVSLMDGEVDARNRVEGGSVFGFTCPVSASHVVRPDLTLPDLSGRRFGVCAPADSVFRQLASMLEPSGVELFRFPVEAISEAATGKVDMIFFDVGDNEGARIQYLRQALEGMGEDRPPVVAIGSVAIFEEEFQVLEALTAGRLIKPLRYREIVRLILREFFRGQASPEVDPDPVSVVNERDLGKKTPLSILVVDGNPVTRRVLMLGLGSFGYHPDGAHDLDAACEFLRFHSYNLIFVDSRAFEEEGAEDVSRFREAIFPGGDAKKSSARVVEVIPARREGEDAREGVWPDAAWTLERPVPRGKLREVIGRMVEA